MQHKKTITKADAIKIVYNAAPRYVDKLAGRNLLFLCTDKHLRVFGLEVLFTTSRFLHLTGFVLQDKSITADDFLNRCVERRLSPRDFEFSEDGTTQLKMRALPLVMRNDLGANMLGDYNQARPKLYTEKMVGGVNACVGFVRDGGTGPYVPNTMLDCDIKDEVQVPLRVVATFRKHIADEKFTECVRKSKGVDWSRISLPEEYEYLLELISGEGSEI